MANYEVMFILDPALEDDKKDATVETVKTIIASEGEVGNVDVWGMKKLAYPIQKKAEGYYVVVEDVYKRQVQASSSGHWENRSISIWDLQARPA